MKRIGTIISNMLWFASSLKAFFTFRTACGHLRKSQIAILKKQIGNLNRLSLLKNSEKELLTNFTKLPLTEYEEYKEDINAVCSGERERLTEQPILLLMPTSGTSGGSRLIPYTQMLLEEYQRGTANWVAEMFFNYPSLLAGKQYWSITPNSTFNFRESSVPIGFDSDTEYLGAFQRFFSNKIMAVPDEIAKIADMKAFEYITLLFLLKTRNLRFISVWHPSFLTILIEKISLYFDDIIEDIANGTIKKHLDVNSKIVESLNRKLHPNARRAEELRNIDIKSANFAKKIWPELKLVSCWQGCECELPTRRLKEIFPEVQIQPKGIAATEGIVSVPIGCSGEKVLAVTSHFFEFIEDESEEVKFAWEVEKGQIYSVVLTNGGGLCRYKLHDKVKVTGFFKEAPLLEFLGRDNMTSDLTGEKVHISHIERLIGIVDREFSLSAEFAGVVADSSGTTPRYRLFIYAPNCELRKLVQRIEKRVEDILCENFHYLHARNLGQLGHITAAVLECDPTEVLHDWFVTKGRRAGGIKIPLLLPKATLKILEQHKGKS